MKDARNTQDAGGTRPVGRRSAAAARCLPVAGLLLAALLAGGTRAALGAGTEFNLRGHDLQIVVDGRWAGGAQGGYWPVRIRARNLGPARNLEFLFEPDSKEGMPVVTRTVGLEQNATAQFTLSVPLVGNESSGQFRVHQDGRLLEGFAHSLAVQSVDTEHERPSLLVIGTGAVDFGPYESAVTTLLAERSGASGGIAMHYGGPYGMYGGSVSRGEDHEIVPVASLPENWIDWSGLDLVAVPLESLGRMGTGPRQALIRWVRAGGNLIVTHVGKAPRDSTELARLLELPPTGPGDAWTAPAPARWRFVPAVATSTVSPAAVAATFVQGGDPSTQIADAAEEVLRQVQQREEDDRRRWKVDESTFAVRDVLLGSVTAFPGEAFPGTASDWLWLLGTLGRERTTWMTRTGVSARLPDPEFLSFLIPGVRGVPTYSFLALITLFAVTIGPINYVLLHRRKRLVALVATIPAIALVTSLLLFGYSVVAHGFGVKSRVRSVTYLDQRTRTAVTVGRTALFAGQAPSGGLRFGPETAVYPIWAPDTQFGRGRVDWTETQACESGWLPSRTRVQFLSVVPREERGRLTVTPAGSDALDVSNGTEWAFEMLLVKDDAGRSFAARDVPVGAGTRLAPSTAADAADLRTLLDRAPFDEDVRKDAQDLDLFDFARRFGYAPTEGRAPYASSRHERIVSEWTSPPRAVSDMPPRCFVAVLRSDPGTDTGLRKSTPRAGWHVLVGRY